MPRAAAMAADLTQYRRRRPLQVLPPSLNRSAYAVNERANGCQDHLCVRASNLIYRPLSSLMGSQPIFDVQWKPRPQSLASELPDRT
jgi:hypothetical protein